MVKFYFPPGPATRSLADRHCREIGATSAPVESDPVAIRAGSDSVTWVGHEMLVVLAVARSSSAGRRRGTLGLTRASL